MDYFTDLILLDVWHEKMSELFIQNLNKCSDCDNFKFLQNISIGYLLKVDGPCWSETSGTYKITTSSTSSNLIYVKPTDNYTRKRHRNSDQINVYYDTETKIKFDENKFYLIYFDNNDSISRNLLGVVELDNPFENDLWFNSFSAKTSNPFRKRSFFRKAKFIFIKGLYIHHLAFQDRLVPWSYDNKWLKCVCWNCLEVLTNRKRVLLLNSNGKVISHLKTCPRCHGQGVFHQYRNYENGVCFNCKGKRNIE